MGWGDCNCEICTEGAEAFYDRMRNSIKEYGSSIIAVGAQDEDHAPFFYSVGNHEKNLPEFLVIGNIPMEIGHEMLNELCEIQQEKGEPLLGLVDLRGKYPVKLVDSTTWSTKSDYTIQVGRYYDTLDYNITRVFLSDKEGRYPDDKNYDLPLLQQPGPLN